jgi:hypothetical protein
MKYLMEMAARGEEENQTREGPYSTYSCGSNKLQLWVTVESYVSGLQRHVTPR